MAEEFRCKGELPYRPTCWDGEYRDTGYCVLHFPGEEKKDDFQKVKESKLAQEDYDFGGTIFPEGTSDFTSFESEENAANFDGATFIGEADFSRAHFNGEETVFKGAQFRKGANFSEAVFSSQWTSFSEAEFSAPRWTSFSGAQFGGRRTDFMRTQFLSAQWTSFSGAQFSSKRTDFRGAQFGGKRTDLSRAHFSGEETDFNGAEFMGEEIDFSEVQFFSARLTYFIENQFSSKRTYFTEAQFSSAFTGFSETRFTEEVVFSGVTFKEGVIFLGTNDNRVFGSRAWAWFDYARIDKPELLTFNTVLLRPSWFINTDVRKVIFTDVKWYGMPDGPEGTLDEEIAALRKRYREQEYREQDVSFESAHTLLAQACRRLSANAEENHEYPLANEFHYWSMDALRIGSWSVIYEALLKEEVRQHIREAEQRDIKFKDLKPKALDVRALLKKDTRDHIRGRRRFGVVNSLYWVLSGYGVRAGRALGVLVTIAVVFAVLYMIVGHPSLRVLPIEGIWQVLADAGQAVMYSLGVMARLRPEPIPKEMGPFQILVTVEGILGPLQIALLALAIRRKVMR